MANETDVRLNILNSLLDSTHRDIGRTIDVHKKMIDDDALFYGHLAAWSMTNTDVRDHKETFVANLMLSEHPEHREAAYCLIQNLPPYQVAKIKNHIKNIFKRNPPRIMKSAVKTYLKAFERDQKRFDNAVTSRQRKALTSLYSSFRLQPGMSQPEDTTVVVDGEECKVTRAQAILFENQPPVGSKPHQVKVLASTEDPTEQAKMIVEHSIPYTTASGAIKHMTPTVLVALINQMSDQELLVNMGSLKARGALDNTDTKALVDQKLKKVKRSKKVDALKAVKVVESVSLDEDMSKELMEVSEQQLKRRGTIKCNTALLVDASGSMRVAIEIGKGIGTVLSTISEGDFYCYAFDVVASEVKCNSQSLEDWHKAMRMIKAGGGTSCGCGVQRLIRKNQRVEQIIMVTDQGENNSPYFINQMEAYKAKFGFMPRIVFVNCGRWMSDRLEKQCKANNIECDTITVPDGVDYYSLPNLIPLLIAPSRVDLLEEIMDTPLPTRDSIDKRTVRLVQ